MKYPHGTVWYYCSCTLTVLLYEQTSLAVCYMSSTIATLARYRIGRRRTQDAVYTRARLHVR
jgi:hypothetical protein